MILEIAANSLASAQAAQAGGAARVELCAALELGGLTPSHATIELTRAELHIALYVLIRPRAGDFLYHASEVRTMCRDIEACARLGCDGVVVGAMDADGGIDMATCRDLVGAAGALGITFHRAFDLVHDKERALEEIIELGCERVLTSGGAPDAMHGAACIAGLVRQAAGRLAIMPGAGIRADNVAALAAATGADEFHASAKRLLPSRLATPHAFPDMAAGEWRTSEPEVRALVAALARAAQADPAHGP